MCELCSSKETPCWRRGPNGPGTLCNACGIKWKNKLKKEENGNNLTSSNSTPSINISSQKLSNIIIKATSIDASNANKGNKRTIKKRLLTSSGSDDCGDQMDGFVDDDNKNFGRKKRSSPQKQYTNTKTTTTSMNSPPKRRGRPPRKRGVPEILEKLELEFSNIPQLRSKPQLKESILRCVEDILVPPILCDLEESKPNPNEVKLVWAKLVSLSSYFPGRTVSPLELTFQISSYRDDPLKVPIHFFGSNGKPGFVAWCNKENVKDWEDAPDPPPSEIILEMMHTALEWRKKNDLETSNNNNLLSTSLFAENFQEILSLDREKETHVNLSDKSSQQQNNNITEPSGQQPGSFHSPVLPLNVCQ